MARDTIGINIFIHCSGIFMAHIIANMLARAIFDFAGNGSMTQPVNRGGGEIFSFIHFANGL